MKVSSDISSASLSNQKEMAFLSILSRSKRCHFIQFHAYKDIWKWDENKKNDCRKLLFLISHKTNLEWNALLSQTAGRSLILMGTRQSQTKTMIMYANDLEGEFSVGLCMHAVRTYFTKHPWHRAFIYLLLCLITLETIVDQISWIQIQLQFNFQLHKVSCLQKTV